MATMAKPRKYDSLSTARKVFEMEPNHDCRLPFFPCLSLVIFPTLPFGTVFLLLGHGHPVTLSHANVSTCYIKWPLVVFLKIIWKYLTFHQLVLVSGQNSDEVRCVCWLDIPRFSSKLPFNWGSHAGRPIHSVLLYFMTGHFVHSQHFLAWPENRVI